jgi:two-component system response regulator NreC
MKQVPPSIRVLLADDHPLILYGMERILNMEKNFKVVCLAHDGCETVLGIEKHQPDIALVDIMMPQLNGFEVVSKLRMAHNNTKVIFLSMHDHPEFISQAIELKANGYLLKDDSPEHIINAIHTVMNGATFYSPNIASNLVKKILVTRDTVAKKSDIPILSLRERQVLRLISQGYTNAEIGEQLHLSKRTIETHRKRIMERMQTRNTVLLLKKAAELGLLSLSSEF